MSGPPPHLRGGEKEGGGRREEGGEGTFLWEMWRWRLSPLSSPYRCWLYSVWERDFLGCDSKVYGREKYLESNAKFHNSGSEFMKKPKTLFHELSVLVTIEILSMLSL